MNYEKNNNGKVIGKLARDSIKTSKMRNAFIAVTIILSVSLLMVMSLFTVEMKEADKRAMARAQHAIYYNLTDDKLHRLTQDSRVSYLTLGKRGQAVEIDNYTLVPVYVDGNSMDIKTMDLLDGKLTTHTYLAPYIPAEKIVNIREYDTAALEAALTGGGE